VDPPVTLACALKVEERIARRGGAKASLIGLGGGAPIPDGRLVSFGFAGALNGRFRPGALVSATKVVDASGAVVWEGEPLDVAGAEPAVVCGASGIADTPGERELLAETTSADVIDLESAALARTGRIAGVVRAISDTPDRPLGKLSAAATRDGRTDWKVVLAAFVTEPRNAIRAAKDARKASAALSGAARELS
jgi:hypothetical protein